MIIKPEDRLAYIKKAAAKFNKKIKRNARVRDYTTPVEDRSTDDSINIHAWTDAEKYVDEYYGDRARAQASYESEWN